MTPRARLTFRWFTFALILCGAVGWRHFSRTTDVAIRHDATLEQGAPESVSAAAGTVEDHLARLGVERAQRAGWRGQGVTVAVLDSGFRGYRSALGRGLPTKVQTKSFQSDADLEARDSQHGILCGEVLHQLAPDAKLIFANWDPDNPESFLEAVRWAKAQGARVCSCSLIMPSWSDGDGGGRIHAELGRLIGDGRGSDDMLFCACAGNIAQRHWTGRLRTDECGYHQWQAGWTSNPLTPWGAERVLVELYGPITAACTLQVWSGQQLIGETKLAAQPGATWSTASVRVDPEVGQRYQVRLRWSGEKPTTDRFHVVALGGYLDFVTAPGSIPFPGDGARVLTVGAVNGQGQRTIYSSCGPNSKLPKPDLVAEVPFPTRLRAKGFAGTSAAAPQAAGLAALVWSGHPAWTAAQVAKTLRESAVDLGPVGHDFETGFGLLRLP